MKHTKKILFVILSLLLLCGCADKSDNSQNPPEGENTPDSSAAETAYPSLFSALPVTEEAISALYAADESFHRTVESIEPYDTDFLVRYTNAEGNSMWDWVYGETGRIVTMISDYEEIASVGVIRPGHLRVTTTGINNIVPQKTLPRTYEVMALGTAGGLTYSGNGETVNTMESEIPSLLSVSDSAAVGYVDDNGALSPGDHYAQLYDARVDVDGLSFSFIPSGEPSRYLSFFSSAAFPACYETSFDEDSREFTIRLYNTCLQSGEGTKPGDGNDLGKDVGFVKEELGVDYPYAFPAGIIGKDNRYVKEAVVNTDDEDLVITMTLSDFAAYYTVESSINGKLIPSLRFVFYGESGAL